MLRGLWWKNEQQWNLQHTEDSTRMTTFWIENLSKSWNFCTEQFPPKTSFSNLVEKKLIKVCLLCNFLEFNQTDRWILRVNRHAKTCRSTKIVERDPLRLWVLEELDCSGIEINKNIDRIACWIWRTVRSDISRAFVSRSKNVSPAVCLSAQPVVPTKDNQKWRIRRWQNTFRWITKQMIHRRCVGDGPPWSILQNLKPFALVR